VRAPDPGCSKRVPRPDTLERRSEGGAEPVGPLSVIWVKVTRGTNSGWNWARRATGGPVGTCIAVGFRRVVIDWTEGDRYVEARINKAVQVGYSGILLEAEHAMRGRMVLVSVADDPDPDAVWVRFHLLMTRDEESNESLDLNYLPGTAVAAGRALAVKLAGLLEYEFVPWEGGADAEPDRVLSGGDS
jgi:hypothetical protein